MWCLNEESACWLHQWCVETFSKYGPLNFAKFACHWNPSERPFSAWYEIFLFFMTNVRGEMSWVFLPIHQRAWSCTAAEYPSKCCESCEDILSMWPTAEFAVCNHRSQYTLHYDSFHLEVMHDCEVCRKNGTGPSVTPAYVTSIFFLIIGSHQSRSQHLTWCLQGPNLWWHTEYWCNGFVRRLPHDYIVTCSDLNGIGIVWILITHLSLAVRAFLSGVGKIHVRAGMYPSWPWHVLTCEGRWKRNIISLWNYLSNSSHESLHFCIHLVTLNFASIENTILTPKMISHSFHYSSLSQLNQQLDLKLESISSFMTVYKYFIVFLIYTIYSVAKFLYALGQIWFLHSVVNNDLRISNVSLTYMYLS